MFFFDLDGTITRCEGFGASKKRFPWWFLWLALTFYRPKINREILLLILSVKQSGGRVAVITNRPKNLEKLTRRYLKKNGVPYDKIFFLSPGPYGFKRKVEKAKKEGARFLYDNNKQVVREAEKEGIKAFLV